LNLSQHPTFPQLPHPACTQPCFHPKQVEIHLGSHEDFNMFKIRLPYDRFPRNSVLCLYILIVSHGRIVSFSHIILLIIHDCYEFQSFYIYYLKKGKQTNKTNKVNRSEQLKLYLLFFINKWISLRIIIIISRHQLTCQS
jgi:hypothetical protein